MKNIEHYKCEIESLLDDTFGYIPKVLKKQVVIALAEYCEKEVQVVKTELSRVILREDMGK